MPLLHAAGSMFGALGPVAGRFAQVLPPGFHPGLVLHLVESEHGSTFGGAPTMLLALLAHPDFAGRARSPSRSPLGFEAMPLIT